MDAAGSSQSPFRMQRTNAGGVHYPFIAWVSDLQLWTAVHLNTIGPVCGSKNAVGGRT